MATALKHKHLVLDRHKTTQRSGTSGPILGKRQLIRGCSFLLRNNGTAKSALIMSLLAPQDQAGRILLSPWLGCERSVIF